MTVAVRGVPMMANAIAAGRGGEAPAAVAWNPAAPPAWDPVVRPPAWDAGEVAALADWLAARVAVPDIDLHGAAERLLGASTGRAIAAGVALAARSLVRGTVPG